MSTCPSGPGRICPTEAACQEGCFFNTADGGRRIDTAPPRLIPPLRWFERVPGVREIAAFCAGLVTLAFLLGFVIRAIQNI